MIHSEATLIWHSSEIPALQMRWDASMESVWKMKVRCG